MPSPSDRLEIPRRLSGTRFDRVLAELFPDQSGSRLQKLVRRGMVEVDGKKVLRSNFKVSGGEVIVLRAPVDPAPPEGLEWLHIDETVAAVSKPAGLLTHRVGDRPDPAVATLAVDHLGPLPCMDDDARRPGVVHRLDRETSGVLLIARTEEAMENLREQFRTRQVRKRYLALVHGDPERDRFVVDEPLARAPGKGDRECVDPRGRAARTEFEVLARSGLHALVECRPETGRRHQLRVHLHHVGHPVVGDSMYRSASGGPRVRAPHHMLHAASIGFLHPSTGAHVQVEAGTPGSFDALIDQLGLARSS